MWNSHLYYFGMITGDNYRNDFYQSTKAAFLMATEESDVETIDFL